MNQEIASLPPFSPALTGCIILQFYLDFVDMRITINELDEIISKLYYKLDYPNWLDMLARNCEYATDIEPFQEPFIEEIKYVTGIWKNSMNIEEFRKTYDRKVSQSHDCKFMN